MNLFIKLSFISIHFLIFNFVGIQIHAQTQEDYALIRKQLSESKASDISQFEFYILDAYTDKINGIRHIYFVQSLDGIQLGDHISSIHLNLTDGNVLKNVIFIDNPIVENRLLTGNDAYLSILEKAGEKKLLGKSKDPSCFKQEDQGFHFVCASSDYSSILRPQYQIQQSGKYRQIWVLTALTESMQYKETGFDQTGNILWSHTLDPHGISNPICDQTNQPHSIPSIFPSRGTDGASYNVFELPLENPNLGNRSIVENPSDEDSSPFGWHDTNGESGPEYTITRGNNARVMPDRDGNFSPDYSVDGGSQLTFNFPFDPNKEPQDNQSAAVTNTFYTVNMCHDILYHFGFTEEAGNFQSNNYGAEGKDGDEVEVYVQYLADDPLSENPPALNNANFTTQPDGTKSTLQLYIWDPGITMLLEVISPGSISGQYETGFAYFGPSIGSSPYEADIILADDGVGFPNDACQPLQNAAEINGNIALIDRGDCRFGDKVLAAQDAGAIAAIVCNNRPGGTTNMVDEINGHLVNIPSVFISQDDCTIIKENLGTGVVGKIEKPSPNGPETLDGGIDNGLVIHEYVHGLTNRLTGGPSRINCLNNNQYGAVLDGEQMGEGWSDFIALAFTHSPGDEPNTARGFASYLRGSMDRADGIRTFPYSTDLNVNPVTYYSIYDASVPHGVGQVWASMLWDLYWKFIDIYDFDPDLINGNGGNKKALEIVIEGLKMQVCDPGFIDGRDAILDADEILNGGIHKCIIWEVFARRGLGFSAKQGINERRRDGFESYDMPDECIPTVKISKTMTGNIEAGDTILVQLLIRNDTESETGELRVEDIIPQFAEPIEITLPGDANIEAGKVTIPIDPIEAGKTKAIVYLLKSSPDKASRPIWEDNLEDGLAESRWTIETFQGDATYEYRSSGGIDDGYHWFIENTDEVNIHSLVIKDPIEIGTSQPVLRFAHKFETESGTDGGLIEISDDGGTNWYDLGDHIFRIPYNNRISLNTFNQTDQNGFTGRQTSWKYTYADLSQWGGKHVLFRFKFGSDFQFDGDGWYLDNFEVFEALNYQSEVSVWEEDLVLATSIATEWGSIVKPDRALDSKDQNKEENSILLYPNPANTEFTIQLNTDEVLEEVLIFDASGTQVMHKIQSDFQSTLKINIANLSEGIYFIETRSNASGYVNKIHIIR